MDRRACMCRRWFCNCHTCLLWYLSDFANSCSAGESENNFAFWRASHWRGYKTFGPSGRATKQWKLRLTGTKTWSFWVRNNGFSEVGLSSFVTISKARQKYRTHMVWGCMWGCGMLDCPRRLLGSDCSSRHTFREERGPDLAYIRQKCVVVWVFVRICVWFMSFGRPRAYWPGGSILNRRFWVISSSRFWYALGSQNLLFSSAFRMWPAGCHLDATWGSCYIWEYANIYMYWWPRIHRNEWKYRDSVD
jgi:hypothetical protein